VAHCTNTQLLQAARRSQALIATHSAFQRYQSGGEIARMLEGQDRPEPQPGI
jgi:hypothetical protein